MGLDLSIEQVVLIVAGIIALSIGLIVLIFFSGGTENFLRLLTGFLQID